MTATVVILCGVISICFGLIVGRLYVWICDERDEREAWERAAIKARFDAHRFDDFIIDEPYVPAASRRPFDWGTE